MSMFHKAVHIDYLKDTIIQALFQDGSVKQFDISVLFERHTQLKALDNWELFSSGRLAGGYGIIWNDDLDIDIETIYQEGTLIRTEEPSAILAIGEMIQSLRAKRGISQKGLAALTGIDQGDISKLERGRGNPSVRTLERVVKALDGRITISAREDLDAQLPADTRSWDEILDEAKEEHFSDKGVIL